MSEKVSLKTGSVMLIAGSLLAIVSNLMHARPTDITNSILHLEETAAAQNWFYDHFFIMFSFLILVLGLVAISNSIREGAAGVWAEYAKVMAIISVAVSTVFLAFDGYVLKHVGDLWAAASETERGLMLPSALAVDEIDNALFYVWGFVMFGLTPILYGLAIAMSGVYSKWLGWLAILSGIITSVPAIILFHLGPANMPVKTIVMSFLVFCILLLIVGVQMWRRAKTV